MKRKDLKKLPCLCTANRICFRCSALDFRDAVKLVRARFPDGPKVKGEGACRSCGGTGRDLKPFTGYGSEGGYIKDQQVLTKFRPKSPFPD